MREKNAPRAPDTPELATAMKAAYAGVLRHGAQLLAVWRSNLSDHRAAELAAFEAKGLTLGLLISTPGSRVLVQAILTDAAGGIQILDEISLAGH